MQNPFDYLEPPQAAPPPVAQQMANPFDFIAPPAQPTREPTGQEKWQAFRRGLTSGFQEITKPQRQFLQKNLETGQGLKQRALQAGELVGLADDGAAQNYVDSAVNQRENFYSAASNQANGIIDKATQGAAGFTGDVLPYLAIPGAASGSLTKQLLANAGTGLGIGLSRFAPNEGDTLLNAGLGVGGGALGFGLGRGVASQNPWIQGASRTALGGLLGASTFGLGGGLAGSLAGGFAPQIASRVLSRSPDLAKKAEQGLRNPIDNFIAKDYFGNVDDNAVQQAMARQQAAQRLDPNLRLTPAEAFGDTVLAAKQGKLGTSKQGARKLLDEGKKGLQTQEKIVREFLDEVSPAKESAAFDIRATAKEVLDEGIGRLRAKASPYYKKSEGNLLPDNEFSKLRMSPVFNKYLNTIKKDAEFADELAGFPDNSVKVLDYVKKSMDAKIKTLQDKEGISSNRARALIEFKNKLTNTVDQYSGDYQTARALYSEGAKPLQELKQSRVGQLASLKDINVEKSSKIIFDRAQTNSKTFAKMRDELGARNPDAWRAITRGEIERRLNIKGNFTGSNFYNNVLKRPEDFNQFMAATKNIPGANQKLKDMRESFQYLLNPVTPQTAARLAKSSLDVPRSSYEAVSNFAKNFLGGKYDQAQVNFIYSNKWDKDLSKIRMMPKGKRSYAMAELLSRISAAESTDEDR